jgi:hypothetical protein
MPTQFPRGAKPCAIPGASKRKRFGNGVFRSVVFTGFFKISGVTRDSEGTVLGGCDVHLFRTTDDVEVGQVVSDSSTGAYSFTVGSNAEPYYIVAFKAGSPDVSGTTVNTLHGSEVPAVSLNIPSGRGPVEGTLPDHNYRLRRYFNSLGQVGKNSAGTGLGGIDILVIGDSQPEGYSSSSVLYDSIPHQLKKILQAKYNPSGVQGGFGYVKCLAGNSVLSSWGPPFSSDIWTFVGTDWDAAKNYDWGPNLGGPGGEYAFTNTVGGRAYLTLDGSSALASQNRLNFSHFELVLAIASVSGTTTYDCSAAAGPLTIGAGTVTGTETPGTGDQGGYHQGIVAAPNRAALQTLQVGINSNYTVLNGGIFYDGDSTCGVRLHSCCNSSSKSTDVDASALVAQQQFALGTKAGATECKLVILWFMTNDVNPSGGAGSPSNTSVADYTTAMGNLIDSYLAWASKPSVLCVVPPANTNSDNYLRWQGYVDALYGVVEDRDHCAIFDLWKVTGNTTWVLGPQALGWDEQTSGVHFGDLGAYAVAEIMGRAL